MRIIISPAKKMNSDPESLEYTGMPVFLEDTQHILNWMQKLSYQDARKLWGCNEKIAEQNYERIRHMDLYRNLTPAVLSYEGIQYQYMAPAVFEDKMLEYVQEHLRILSGFYGVLKPMDGVRPYRLEMQARAAIEGKDNLYAFWNSRLYGEVIDLDRTIINLASKEYSKCIEAYLRPEDNMITCIFGEMEGSRVVQKGTYAKMARGEMVRFMAMNRVERAQDLQQFEGLGYGFSRELSSGREYVFLRNAGQTDHDGSCLANWELAGSKV